MNKSIKVRNKANALFLFILNQYAFYSIIILVMLMKCIFIYNPNSGKGKIAKKLDYIKNELYKKYDYVEIHSTVSRQDLIDTAKDSCNKYDAIIFSGGDGTFNDIVSSIATQEKRPILGYIPSGTVNDIARNLKISKNIKKAIKVILDGEYSNHDVGKINGSYFVYVAAIGTFSAVSYRTKQSNKRKLGKLAYVVNGVSDFFHPSIIEIKVITEEGKVYSGMTPLSMVINSISVGGIRFNKQGHLNDGLFDIIIVKKIMKHGMISIARTMLIGIGRKKQTKYFEVIRSAKFKIEVAADVKWTIDGEKGIEGPVEIENIHNHIQIYVPFKRNKPKSRHLLKHKKQVQ